LGLGKNYYKLIKYYLVIFLTGILYHSEKMHLFLLGIVIVSFLLSAQNKSIGKVPVVHVVFRDGFLRRMRISSKFWTKS
jgi:hypothetical protein